MLSVVLIARRNTSLRVLDALNSILNQIYSPIEVLVVDANEPNSLHSLGLQEDLAAYPNVDYIQMDQLVSNAEIRNYTLHTVEGEYIAYISSNDVWDSTKAYLQIEQLKADPVAAASCSNGVLIDKRKAHLIVEPLIENLSYRPENWVLDNPAKMSAQVIYRVEALKETDGFDDAFENFCDGDMLLRLSKKKKVLINPVSLCECTITPDNEDYDLKQLKDHQKILYKYMELFLTNKRMTQLFYIRMMQLAKVNYQWLNYFIYSMMYFLKSPLRSVLTLTGNCGKLVHYLFKWLYKGGSLINENMRMKRDLRLMRRGKFSKVKAIRPVIPIVRAAAKPVVFSSARQYNERSSLEFAFNRKLKRIVIPEYVTVIRKGMFYGCDQLVSIEIPNTVLEIQARAFQKCTNLRTITIQEGSRLNKIGAYAFSGCSSLETINLPSSMVSIGKGAFFECCSLKQVQFTYLRRGAEETASVFPTAMAKLSRYTFAGCTNLMKVEFGPNSMLETIENGVFMGCLSLRKSLLTGKVKTLGSYAFAHCKKLETAAFPQIDALESIGKCAFMNCESLAYFQLPNQLEYIPIRTFYGCSSMKLIKIPKKVLSINHQAFAKCTSLAKAIILTGDIAIAQSAFDKHTEIQIQESLEQDASEIKELL